VRAVTASLAAALTIFASTATPSGLAHGASDSCSVSCVGGDAGSSADGLTADAGADRGPSGGGPERTTLRGPVHDPCTYQSLSAHELALWVSSYGWQAGGPPAGLSDDAIYGTDPDQRWAVARCPLDTGRNLLDWWPVGAPPPAALIDALREQARDAVPFPVMAQASAPRGDRDAPLIVQLPTWLWVDPATWHPVTAQASLPGIVTVTATARPAGLHWDPGTGEAPVRCVGPGTPYDHARPDEGQQTDCSYSYRHSSATVGGPYHLTLGLEWDVWWSCAPGCGGGPLPPVTVATRRDVWVAELQALNGRDASD
jgi:hypothetical protein